MVTQQLIDPKSIAIIGGSDNIHSPGGKLVENILSGNFKGDLQIVNPKKDTIKGIKVCKSVEELPNVDLAIIAIAAKYCLATVETLVKEKNTKAFIIISAGFSEEHDAGAKIEADIVKVVEEAGACLIGPNCVGVLNNNYNGVFTTPIPKLDPQGVDFISGSGATAVFIIESGIPKGLKFNSVYSVGNSAQLGVEDILEYLDETFDPETSSKVKLLYIESVNKPQKLLKHASSLVRKGCKIAAIKSGSSDAGSRAASSHTGALASPDVAVDALFKKAGIVRCHGRDELTTVASVFMHAELKGKNIAIITHAGGPAVMLTDALSNNGLDVPHIEGPKADALLEKLYPGSSVANPIDFLATGNAEQLGHIIDACDNDFDNIDAMCVIFGSPGLFPVYDVYEVLHEKMNSCKKPLYPILPSIINVKDEIETFISKGRLNFPDEVIFGESLAKIYNTNPPVSESIAMPEIDIKSIREVIDSVGDGYLAPEQMQKILDAAGIARAAEKIVDNKEDALEFARKTGFPLVMKVVGPLHKSDVGGVVLNVKDEETVAKEFDRLIKIKDTYAVQLNQMLYGTEIFVGAKREGEFGHQVLCGLGGIFIEILKDVQASIAPVSVDEAHGMIKNLRSYGIIKGARGQEPVNEAIFAETIARVSALVKAAPEIAEMDLNPLLGTADALVAVDVRIGIEK